ncbi:nuclear transport factor 2 family protein [Microbulbifer epialgicus]|uniref:Nuclear transport factor 2 family protein n=1 Tax=Microbulbifer epialgicus TaxID=393907 RepID=A0ABV4NVR9_9GAMM
MNKFNRTKVVQSLCRKYLSALEKGDLEALLALFTKDAMVFSPIFGECRVVDFYSYVIKATKDRSMTLKNIMLGVVDPNQVAVYVSYTRAVENNKPATIDTVDVFDLAADLSAFSSVTIIYDTAPVRGDFKAPI